MPNTSGTIYITYNQGHFKETIFVPIKAIGGTWENLNEANLWTMKTETIQPTYTSSDDSKYRCYYQPRSSFLYHKWDETYIDKNDPSILYVAMRHRPIDDTIGPLVTSYLDPYKLVLIFPTALQVATNDTKQKAILRSKEGYFLPEKEVVAMVNVNYGY